MTKGALILLAGLALGAAAFSGFYYFGTAPCRHMMDESQPELAWLKQEFKLSDADFARISALHEEYLPQCAERCRLIDQQNKRLEQLLARDGQVTAEVRNLLQERARTRAECEAQMLQHFGAVSRAMPAEQGHRYLAWVRTETVLRAQAMEARHNFESGSSPAAHHQHH